MLEGKLAGLRAPVLTVGFAALVLSGAALADPAPSGPPSTLTGPTLGAASNFSQGWQPEVLTQATSLPVQDLRDSLRWRIIEGADGHFSITDPRARYPDLLPERGMGMSLTAHGVHPRHDGGVTPHTPAAVAAFAEFIAFAVARFPAIHTVEVGNEMNTDTFVSGPMETSDLDARAAYYVALLRAIWRRVKATDPDIQVLGGAVHSIPLAWISALVRHGAADVMDALAFHPYTTAPEQLVRQVALMRAGTGLGDMPLEVTEFGHTDPIAAPAHFLKHYCQMALAGVRRVVWYPLNPRGDGLEPLIERDGHVTGAGRAYRLIQDQLVGRPVRDAAPDPFTYACQFGPGRLVIWGAPRPLALTDNALMAFDASGRRLDPAGLALSMERPLLIVSDGPPVALGRTVRLGPQLILADSVDQFFYPPQGRLRDDRDPFLRFVLHNGETFAFETRPGQQRGGVPWTPYLGTSRDGLLRLGPDWLVPSAWDNGPLKIVHRYAVPREGPLRLDIFLDPGDDSRDGIDLEILLNGARLDRRIITGAGTTTLPHLTVAAGDLIDVIVGPNGDAKGDSSDIRITVRRPDP